MTWPAHLNVVELLDIEFDVVVTQRLSSASSLQTTAWSHFQPNRTTYATNHSVMHPVTLPECVDNILIWGL